MAVDSRMVDQHQDTKEHRVESHAKLWTGNHYRYTKISWKASVWSYNLV